MTTVGRYVFERLKQVGIGHTFGVPGDFNMPLLDEMLETGMKWVGCCNELNAAYAADGYARANGTLGAVVTTYGVGELSALNGISGAHSEFVPLVHIVGVPSREQVADAPFLHHAPPPTGLRKPDFHDYVRCAEPVSVCQEFLNELGDVTRQVDNAILQAIRFKRPSYIFVPADITAFELPAKQLESPIELNNVQDPHLKEVVDRILDSFKKAKTAVVIADAMTQRYNLGESINRIITKTGAYGATTIMGKGVIDETHPNFLGCYAGNQSRAEVKKLVESADFVLDLGSHHSDYNTGVYTTDIDPSHYIGVNRAYCKVFGRTIHASILEEVVKDLDSTLKDKPDGSVPPKVPHDPKLPSQGPIKSDDFLNLLSTAVRDHDMVIVETGSYQPGSGEIKLQHGGRFICQVGYASIGYTLPAAIGAAVALKEKNPNSRVLLVEGDGSAQMTVQELSTAIRYNLPLTVFLVNNDGYLIERALHGAKQPYNDIAPWNWTRLFSSLGEGKTATHQVRTVEEFDQLVHDNEFEDARYPQLVEVFSGKFDYPTALSTLAEANNSRLEKLNKEYAKEHDA